MKRRMSMELRRWKDKIDRKPLIVRGVRHSGKTWLLRGFGAEYYSDVAYFNFEGNTSLRNLFERERDIGNLLSKLSALHEKTIEPGKTLIIFDEIQFCEAAMASLKDFSEIVPHYHVACASSLLGSGLKQYPFPAGTVDILTLRPLGFYEFLTVSGGYEICDYVRKLRPGEKASKQYAARLEQLLKTYLITGGMPEVVDTWIKTGDFELVGEVQQRILNTFELDFAKYAPNKEFSKLRAVWNSIPAQLAGENSKFMFGHTKRGMRSKDLTGALEWLLNVGLVQQVLRVEEPSLPVSAYLDYNCFKLYMMDHGLLRRMSGLTVERILQTGAGTSFEVGAATGAGVGATMRANTGAGIGAGVGVTMRAKTGVGIGAGVGAAMGANTDAGVGAGVGAAMGANTGAGIGATMGAGTSFDVGDTIGVGTDIGIGVGTGVGIGVDNGIGIGVSTGADTGVGIGAGVGDTLGAGTSFDVGDTVGVGTGIGIGVGTGIGIGVATGADNGVRIGVATGVDTSVRTGYRKGVGVMSVSVDDAGLVSAVVKNYVLSELLNLYGDTPYFWRSGNEAEVDFLIQYGIDFVPIEVKSGNSRRTRSLGEYQKKFSPAHALKVTMRNEDGGKANNIPLYMLWKMDSILNE